MTITCKIEEQQILVDYYVNNNSRGTSSSRVGELTYKYHNEIKEILDNATDGKNEYDIDEAEIERFYELGKKEAQEKTGYKNSAGDKALQTTKTAASAVAGTAGLANITLETANIAATKLGKDISQSAINQAVDKAGGKVMEKASGSFLASGAKKAAKETAEKAATEASEKYLAAHAGEKGVEDAAKKVAEEEASKAMENETAKAAGKNSNQSKAWAIAIPLAALTAADYYIKKPNKTQKDACNEMKSELELSQQEIANSKEDMENMAENLQEIAAERDANREETQKVFDEQETLKQGYQQRRAKIESKKASGLVLSDSEIALYNQAGKDIKAADGIMAQKADESNSALEDTLSTAETYQEGYDNAGKTVEVTRAKTDYTLNIAKSTKTMCYVESVSQGLNGISAGVAAYRAFQFGSSLPPYTTWAYAFAAVGAAASLSSGIASIQQLNYVGELDDDIEVTTETEGFNNDLEDFRSNEVDNYEITMDAIKETTVTRPEEAGTQATITNNTPKAEPKSDKTEKKEVKPDKNIK